MQLAQVRLPEAWWFAPQAAGTEPQEVICQGSNIFFAVPQGWQLDGEDAEPEVKVASERSGFHINLQISVGGGDDAHHGPVLPRTTVVYGPGHQLLAGTGLSQDQDIGLGRCHQLDLLQRSTQGIAIADNLAEGLHLLDLVAQIIPFLLQLTTKMSDFFESPGVGQGHGCVIGEDPQMSVLLIIQRRTAEEAQNAQHFVVKAQWLAGKTANALCPDNWHVTQRLLDRPGNADIQLQLFYDYGSNPPLYPAWQAWMRKMQPPTLIVWGEKDEIFPAAGAYPYERDLKNVEFHLLDTGHFALEEDGELIANLMRSFLGRNLAANASGNIVSSKSGR